jgi:hypothetical protein
MSKLWQRDFSRGNLAMPIVQIYLRRSSSAALSHLLFAPTHGAMLCLPHHCKITGRGIMRLTQRCIDLMNLLKAARWLTTCQIHHRFFTDATIDAARKRLRKLAIAGYLTACQANRMSESVFALGKEAKRYLEKCGSAEIFLAKKPPKEFDHFRGVNDLRLAAELSGKINFFFAYWELPGFKWDHPLIPDAVFSYADDTYFAEFDRGFENTGFFVKTKISNYKNGIDGFPEFSLLIITDSQSRLKSLAAAIGAGSADNFPVLYATIDEIRRDGLSVLEKNLSSRSLLPEGDLSFSNSLQSLRLHNN